MLTVLRGALASVSNLNQIFSYFLAFSSMARYPKPMVVSHFLVCVGVVSDHFRGVE